MVATDFKLIARERRVGSAESQDVDDTTCRPSPYSVVLVR